MKPILSFVLLFCIGSVHAQNTYVIKADSVKLTNCDSSELILENHTQGVKGFLYNTGNGRTLFKKGLVKLTGSTYLIGADTLNLSGGAWVQGGNSFGAIGVLGTLDNNHLDLYTNAVQRGRITNTGNFLINTTTDNGKTFQVNGTGYVNGVLTTTADAIINGITVGNGAGNNASNTAIGLNALQGNPVNGGSTAVGNAAGQFSTGSVTAVGRAAATNSTGNSLIAMGVGAGGHAGGGYDIVIGENALNATTQSGWGVTVIGHLAGQGLTTGYYNTLLGYSTGGGLTTGANNTLIGAQITGLASTLSNTIIIADGLGNQKIYVSASSDVGLNTSSPSSLFQVNQPITGPGTVANLAGGTSVTGTGTEFTNTFQVGDSITIGGQTVAISAIASDVSMTTGAITIIHSAATYTLAGGSRFQVKGNGNAGIGTAAPTSRLDISSPRAYSQLRLRSSYTPSSSADTKGNVGDYAWDANFIYVKTAAGWKRSTLSTF